MLEGIGIRVQNVIYISVSSTYEVLLFAFLLV